VNVIVATLLICNVGGPGTTRQAQPVVDSFLRRLEATGGFEKNSLAGAYFTRQADCDRYHAAKKPKMIVTDLATYLDKQASWKLVPVAHMGTAKATRYHLLVRAGSYKALAELKGKKLVTTLARRPRFLSRIIFGGKVDVAKHFALVRTRRPLKGLRKVARGQAEATVVEELAYKYLGELKLPKKLVSIHASQRLPGLTMSFVSSSLDADKAMKKRVLAVLPMLCKGPGAELCKTFRINAFGRAKASVYKKLARQYK